jgi:hypothetical protein
MPLKAIKLRESSVFSFFSIPRCSQAALTVSCPSSHSLVPIIDLFHDCGRVVCNRNSVTTELYFFVSGKWSLMKYPLLIPSAHFGEYRVFISVYQLTDIMAIHTIRLVLDFRVPFNLQLFLLLLLWKSKQT